MRKINRNKWLLILPATLWVLAFTIFPFFFGIGLSLSDFSLSNQTVSFQGLANYKRFFRDELAYNALTVTLIFVFVGVTIQTLIGLLIALSANHRMPLRSLLRAVIILPIFATPIAVGFLFFTIFYEEGGLINGLIGLKIPWLSSPNHALLSVIIVDCWQWTPFCFLIFLAALQGIPESEYEAALLETKNRWNMFWAITYPHLQPTIILVLLLRITEAFKVFDIPFTLTNGGPGVSTQVLSMFAYFTGMRFFDFAYASAISFLIFVVVIILIMLLFRLIRQVDA